MMILGIYSCWKLKILLDTIVNSGKNTLYPWENILPILLCFFLPYLAEKKLPIRGTIPHTGFIYLLEAGYCTTFFTCSIVIDWLIYSPFMCRFSPTWYRYINLTLSHSILLSHFCLTGTFAADVVIALGAKGELPIGKNGERVQAPNASRFLVEGALFL